MIRRLLLGAALLVTGCGTSLAHQRTVDHTEQEPIPHVGNAENDTRVGQRRPERFAIGSVVPAQVPHRFRMWRFAAPVTPVAVDHGELVPPSDPAVLGWWGRRPGSPHGTTLIVGHSVHTGGGELDRLATTPVGAYAYVAGIAYRVTAVRVMSKARLAARSSRLFHQDGPPRLVVVSCARYDWQNHQWPANAVVTAHPET